MSYTVHSDIGAGNFVPVIPTIESFILYYKFTLGGAVVAFNSYYSAFLSVHSSAVTQGNDAATAPITWPGAANVARDIRIDEVFNGGPTGNSIAWKSCGFIVARAKCGHSHSTLYATGNNAIFAPNQAGTAWNVPAFTPPTQVGGGSPYISQVINVGTNSINAHATVLEGNPGITHAGYVAQFGASTGFDAILASRLGAVAFPPVNLNINGVPVYDVGQPVSGCALVVAGSLSRQISLISCMCKELLAIASLPAFSDCIRKMVDKMPFVPTLESCDDIQDLPQDPPFADRPLEIVFFG